MHSIHTVNPATGETLQKYAVAQAEQIDATILSTYKAYISWSQKPIAERAQAMLRVAELLLENKDQYAQLITTEMGKPIVAATAEIEKCAKVCRYFAENAAEFLKPEVIHTEMQKSCIYYQPLGVIFAIMPWNFPFWQVFRCAAPNLMAGNGIVLKHAGIVTGCGLSIANLFQEAGFSESIFTTLVITDPQAKQVIAHPHIAGITITGSVRAGRTVAALAGAAGKKVVLELGGSDPYIILADANLAEAAKAAVHSRLANSGQVCIAAKRLIVVESVKAEFQYHVMKEIENYTVGDPLNLQMDMGPLARNDLREHLQQQVETSVRQGAVLVQGGEIPSGPGFYYPITVLDQVRKGMVAYEEELFGPVITFITAQDEADAIRIANDVPFGLSGAIFTEDIARGEKIAAEQIQVGVCYVNAAVSSDPRLPFGGIKASGFGRELAKAGMHEFVNVKTVAVK